MLTTERHTGRNIKAIREILRVKQEVLADALGMSQQSVSLIEQRETVDAELLQKVAAVLKVPVEAIENYKPDAAVSYISNTYSNTNESTGSQTNANGSSTFNHYADKLIELYERMLKEKDAEIERLRQQLK